MHPLVGPFPSLSVMNVLLLQTFWSQLGLSSRMSSSRFASDVLLCNRFRRLLTPIWIPSSAFELALLSCRRLSLLETLGPDVFVHPSGQPIEMPFSFRIAWFPRSTLRSAETMTTI